MGFGDPDVTRHDGAGGHGPLRYGPPLPESGLPVPEELTATLKAAAERTHAEPPGGDPALLEAACGYWTRRGLPVSPEAVIAGPGGPVLLLALTAALGGDVLLPRPCPAWWAPQAQLLGHSVFSVPTPAECGGVPDPYALLETVHRVRAEGGDPRLLVLTVVDDPTATVAPPEVLHEAVEAAVGEGLHVVCDETLRDTVHAAPSATFPPPAPTGPGSGPVVVSPAEMMPGRVTVLTDLGGAFLPPGWPVAVARLPDTAWGHGLRAAAQDVLTAVGGLLGAPASAAAIHALDEPEEITAWLAAAVRLHARLAGAAYRVVRGAGALGLPPQAGRHLYADLTPLRPALAARGVDDAQDLEDHLTGLLGMPAPGGHRFGDDLAAPRVRLSTAPLLGRTSRQRAEALAAADPLEVPHVEEALHRLREVLDALAAATS